MHILKILAFTIGPMAALAAPPPVGENSMSMNTTDFPGLAPQPYWNPSCHGMSREAIEADPRFNNRTAGDIDCFSPRHTVWNPFHWYRAWYITLPSDNLWDDPDRRNGYGCGTSVWEALGGMVRTQRLDCVMDSQNTSKIVVETCRICKVLGIKTKMRVEWAINEATCGYYDEIKCDKF